METWDEQYGEGSLVGILLVGTIGHAQIPQQSVLLGTREKGRCRAIRPSGTCRAWPVIDVTLERIVGDNLDGNLYHYSEFVDATRIADPAYTDALHDMLRSKYGGSRFDLIFVMGDVAYSFVSRYRGSFFPETPIVFSTSDPVRVMSNSTGILTPINIKGHPGHPALYRSPASLTSRSSPVRRRSIGTTKPRRGISSSRSKAASRSRI